MGFLKVAACILPLFAGLAMASLEIADWSLWGPNPRDSWPQLWRGIDWLMFPFVMAGLPLLAPSAWFLLGLSSLVSRLVGLEASQNSGFFLLFHCLLFGIYLAVRGRSFAPGDMLWASGAGSLVLVLFALLSALAVRGSGDGQAAIAFLMGQNGSLTAGVLVAEWLLRRVGRRAAP